MSWFKSWVQSIDPYTGYLADGNYISNPFPPDEAKFVIMGTCCFIGLLWGFVNNNALIGSFLGFWVGAVNIVLFGFGLEFLHWYWS